MASSESFNLRGHYGSFSESLPDEESRNRTTLQLDLTDSSEDIQTKRGSSWFGASLNLTSSIVGAGLIGLGGAIANSGGLISIVSICIFAILSKFSFDLIVSLAIESEGEHASSYESLGYAAYGRVGKLTVIISKGLYSFGTLVAYIVIIKDNFSFAILHLLYGDEDMLPAAGWLQSTLGNQNLVTIILCSTIMLPLCLLRDLTPLERFSALKIIAVMLIVVIVVYLFFTLSDENSDEAGFGEHWMVVRGGMFESLGTFVFTFVAQHAVHLVFQSLRPSCRNMENFEKASSLAAILSTLLSLTMGLFVYMTFWEATSSDMFNLYPSLRAVDICRLLLCLSMLLTYPFPFLTVRELIILLFCTSDGERAAPEPTDTTEPLIGNSFSDSRNSWLLPGEERQLKRNYHVALTVLIWSSTLFLAIKASSLGAVLNLTGCATGTVIAYILPALFSLKLRGHTVLGSLLFILGGAVGVLGTFYSVLALFQ